jgi:hypothetical protein
MQTRSKNLCAYIPLIKMNRRILMDNKELLLANGFA